MYKKLKFFGLAALVLALGVTAFGTSSPIEPWVKSVTGIWRVDDRGVASIYENSEEEGLNLQRVAHAYYNFAVDGGGTVGTPVDLGVTLPADALITRAYYRVKTAFAPTPASGNLMGVFCEDNPDGATNIIASAQNASFGVKYGEGLATGAASAFVAGIGAACNLKLYTSSHTFSAGQMDVWVHYAVSTN